MVIADEFIESEVVQRHPGFENYLDLEETRAALTSQGDEIVLEWLDDDDESDEEEERGEDPIRVSAELLKKRVPHLADAFEGFVLSQEIENQFLDEHFEDAIWILQRGH